MPLPEPICLRVAELRRRGTPDLRTHLADPRNVHVCRAGRVFIGTGAAKRVFHYAASPWANPYPVTKDRPLDMALEMYVAYLSGRLRDPARLAEFFKLRNAATIGCFCEPGARCHRDTILAFLRYYQQTGWRREPSLQHKMPRKAIAKRH